MYSQNSPARDVDCEPDAVSIEHLAGHADVTATATVMGMAMDNAANNEPDRTADAVMDLGIAQERSDSTATRLDMDGVVIVSECKSVTCQPSYVVL